MLSTCHYQPGHPSVGRRNEYQPKGGDALRLGVKAGMDRIGMLKQPELHRTWDTCFLQFMAVLRRT